MAATVRVRSPDSESESLFHLARPGPGPRWPRRAVSRRTCAGVTPSRCRRVARVPPGVLAPASRWIVRLGVACTAGAVAPPGRAEVTCLGPTVAVTVTIQDFQGVIVTRMVTMTGAVQRHGAGTSRGSNSLAARRAPPARRERAGAACGSAAAQGLVPPSSRDLPRGTVMPTQIMQ